MKTAATRVLVTCPDTRQFVTTDPLNVADVKYPRSAGYELRTVRGHDGPYGFVHDGQVLR